MILKYEILSHTHNYVEIFIQKLLLLLLLIASRFIPSGVVRENGAPNATVILIIYLIFMTR